MTDKKNRVVIHEPECRCPVEAFAGRAIDCFDHPQCQCMPLCKQVSVPSEEGG